MLPKHFSKSVDLAVFATLIYLGVQYYTTAPYIFDLIGFSALIYVCIRKHDINTLTLAVILALADFIPIAVFYNFPAISGYGFYALIFAIDIFVIVMVWLRPFLLVSYGPNSIRQNKYIALTHQDSIVAIIYTFHAVLQLSLFLEHLLRHLDDIGLEGLFGEWKPMLFYNMYPVAQFGFSILVFMALYFMTFDTSKNSRQPKTA